MSELRRLAFPFSDYLVSDEGVVYTDKCKVRPEDVETMRRMAANGERQRDIAARFGVSQGSVSLYLLGQAKHPPGVPRPMRTAMTGARYPGVTLCNRAAGIDKVTKHVHELVALAFIGPLAPGQQVRHLDGDRTNNRAANLAHGTALENATDRERHGRTARGERGGNAKLTEEQVKRLRATREAGGNVSREGARMGVSSTTASRASRGVSWKGQ